MPGPIALVTNDVARPTGAALFDVENRAFRYGDGLFETLLLREGRSPRWNAHLERMLNGMQVLCFEFDARTWPEKMRAASERLYLIAGKPEWARLRITVYRGGGGAYGPETDAPAYTAALYAYDPEPGTALRIGLCEDVRLHYDALSAVKKLSALPYVMARRHARTMGWDEALLRAEDGSLAEATASNLFLVRGGELVTPPLESGCLPGVTRSAVIDAAKAAGVAVAMEPVTEEMLKAAQGVFLTNALRGLQAVAEVAGIAAYAPDPATTKLLGRIRSAL